MIECQNRASVVSDIERYVRNHMFNDETNLWIVHFGEHPILMPKSYGFGKNDIDEFFSHFMDLSLRYYVKKMDFDIDGDSVKWVNFYLSELENGQNTNITIDLMETVAKGWGEKL